MKDQTVRGSSMLKITYGNAISICINDGISTVQCTIHAPCHEYDFYDKYLYIGTPLHDDHDGGLSTEVACDEG